MERAGADEAGGNLFKGLVGDGRANAVGPRAPVGDARRGKRRAAQLFGVEAEGGFLWGILPGGQCSGDSLGCELIAKAGLIWKCLFCHG